MRLSLGGAWQKGLMRLSLVLWAVLTLVVLSLPTTAQDRGLSQGSAVGLQTPVLIIDYEALFLRSRFGQRVLREIEEEGAALIAENDRIEAELTAEELVLTGQRETLPPDEFRVLADDFDAKVQQLRRAQQVKAEAVGQGRDAEERRFRQLVTPIIARFMQEAGALVVLDRRDTIVWVDAINITQEVLRVADRVIGEGRNAPAGPGPAQPAPDETATDDAKPTP